MRGQLVRTRIGEIGAWLAQTKTTFTPHAMSILNNSYIQCFLGSFVTHWMWFGYLRETARREDYCRVPNGEQVSRVADHKINRITELLPWNWKKYQGSAKIEP
jgi:hypothetical protein